MALTPSERIVLMKEISQRLAGEDWPLIDVTLKQFSLPWTNEWSGGKDAYVLQMIEGGSGETLVDLARHVGFQLPAGGAPRIEPPF
ncbi:MAG: hypothetical protein PHT49_03415 [Desulfovibrionales bacterium]|nr:hypothetical protein [Desulfovibrionales bacterium]